MKLVTSKKYCVFDSNMPDDWFNFIGPNRVMDPREADFVLVTDHHISNGLVHPNKICLLIESPAIHPNAYKDILDLQSQFKHILTFDREVLNIVKGELCLMGGGWIQPPDWKIYPKSKNVSITVSSKRWTDGHSLRHKVLDCFGSYIEGQFGFMNPTVNNYPALLDYRFNVCIENTRRDFYFSEKVMDCFATGTVPIYWGCPSIGDYFDLDGIIVFESLRDLNKILSNCNEDLYQKMLPAITNNLAKQATYWSYEKSIADVLNRIVNND